MRAVMLPLVLGIALDAGAEPRTVLHGVPSMKVSEGGVERTPQTVQGSEAANLACVVSEIDGKYYWASRENKPLIRLESGAFITYLAVDGTGYVRTVVPRLKTAARSMSATEAAFDYVEHLVVGLRSVTYYGAAR